METTEVNASMVREPHNKKQNKVFWHTHYLSWQKSTVSKVDYCKANQLNHKTFYYWCNRLAIKETPDSPRESQLVKVTLKNKADNNPSLVSLGVRLPNQAKLTLQLPFEQLVPFIKEMCDATAIIR